jgi:hypothetical protein
MWDAADVEDAIARYPHEAADAVAAIQLDSSAPNIEVAGIKLAAQLLGRTMEDLWVETLDSHQLLETFVLALAARGVPIDVAPTPTGITGVDPDKLAAFCASSKAFGCRIFKDRQFAGSGVLIGPTTVLTAWHVVGKGGPKDPQEPSPEIEVLLPDKRRLHAHLPAAYQSMCTDREFRSLFPASDEEVQDRHDVALLRLERPAGALLAAARLPDAPPAFASHASVLVVHFPRGRALQLGQGAIHKARGLTARWLHTAGTEEGSSGGACFDAKLTLIGIHQGKDPRQRGRLVPACRFWSDLQRIVANDVAPPGMWSLDGTPDGELVIGRQGFFQAFAAARRNRRVRGIRIRRADAAGDLGGLPFSYHMLNRLVARSAELGLMRVSFEKLTADIADEIARRATDAGFPVGPIVSAPGVAEGQSAPEAVGADRGRRTAALLNQEAERRKLQLWVFIDHPAITFGDAARATLEAFIDAALNLDNLRLVVAGYEAVALPGQDFFEEPVDSPSGDHGLMTEMLTGFRRSDVRVMLKDAVAAADRTISEERLDELEEDALADLANVNGLYPPWSAGEVAMRLREPIKRYFKVRP